MLQWQANVSWPRLIHRFLGFLICGIRSGGLSSNTRKTEFSCEDFVDLRSRGMLCEIWKFRKLWREQPLWKCSRRRPRRAVSWFVQSSTPAYCHWTMGNRRINIDRPRDRRGVPNFEANPLHELMPPCAVTPFSLAVQVSACPWTSLHRMNPWQELAAGHCRLG